MCPLIIHPKQMKVFEAHAADHFVHSLMRTARKDFAEQVDKLGDAELESLVRHAIERARSHGFTWESSLAGFLALMFHIAPNFDEHPAFRRVLDDKSMQEDERLEAVFSAVSPQEWEEAEEAYDDDAWGISKI